MFANIYMEPYAIIRSIKGFRLELWITWSFVVDRFNYSTRSSQDLPIAGTEISHITLLLR